MRRYRVRFFLGGELTEDGRASRFGLFFEEGEEFFPNEDVCDGCQFLGERG